MPEFFCTYNSSLSDSLDLQPRLNSLREACRRLDINFVSLDESKVNLLELPTPTAEDALYNCARGSYLLERLMLNREVRSFYRNYEVLSQQDDSNILTIELEKQNIPVPRTVYQGTSNRLLLNKYIDHLGGFPVVLKNYGGVSGVGVIKVESYPTLYSLADYFSSKKEAFQIKEFIPSSTCERVTVLGDEVLYTISRPVKENDFRSDGYSDRTRKIELTPELKKIAVSAAHAANLNFAGIDLIVDERTSRPYILEVNCPHNFVQHEKITGENYSLSIVKWLFNIP